MAVLAWSFALACSPCSKECRRWNEFRMSSDLPPWVLPPVMLVLRCISGSAPGVGLCTAEATKVSTTWRTCTPRSFEAGYSTTVGTTRLRFTRYLFASTATLYAGRGTNTTGFADIHAVRHTGYAESHSGTQRCFRTGVSERCHSELEKWEPDARRRARPLLGERGGEIPPRHSTLVLKEEGGLTRDEHVQACIGNVNCIGCSGFRSSKSRFG